MSLLRLLTAGKTLVGLKSSELRYRFSNPRGLPRFNAKKNPFRATTLPDPNIIGAISPATRVELGKPDSAVPAPAKPSPQPSPLPVASKQSSGSGVKRNGLLKQVTRVKSWFGWRNPAKAAGRRPSRPLVQPELSLEKVRVMRNDLSDSDLEIVNAQPAPRPQARPLKPTPAHPAGVSTSQHSWTRVTSRLFGAGKS